ncbi:CinA family protein [Microbulbifer celer]|nr:CinA family protein [Microbulbifer celer]
MSDDMLALAERLGAALQQCKWQVTAAESCTGGAVAAAITAVPGASAWFEGSVVSYSNRIKHEVLGVDSTDLSRLGAVSEPVVRQMAVGVLNRFDANLAVAVSGIAGPDGGTEDKPVGTVWIAWAHGEGQEPVTVDARCIQFSGDRHEVQSQTVAEALRGLLSIAESHL